jgi:hypothetical protein
VKVFQILIIFIFCENIIYSNEIIYFTLAVLLKGHTILNSSNMRIVVSSPVSRINIREFLCVVLSYTGIPVGQSPV